MQTIIVATDFSKIANNAVQYAVDAAKVINGKIVLFHLYKLSSHASHSLVSASEIEHYVVKQKLFADQYARQLGAENQIEIETEVRMGDFLEEVKQVIEQHEGHILVIGMPRKSFEQDILGNTTTATIYKLKFPILAIPEFATFSGIQKILYACDMTRGIHTLVLQSVKRYALLFNANVEVFFVGEAVKKLQDENLFEQNFKEISYTYKNVHSDSVIKAIQYEAEQINADLLIMTPNKYGFWASILHRSKTRAMASNGKIPLLSIAY